MDEKGYAFTPMSLLLFIPIIVVAIAYSGVVEDLNSLSAFAIGGDVTVTIGTTMVKAVQEDTYDNGRYAAFTAGRMVIDSYDIYSASSPFFAPDTSKTFIRDSIATNLNKNLTNTALELEKQTGREIYFKDSGGTFQRINSSSFYDPGTLTLSQSDPYGFNVSVPSKQIMVVQSSNKSYQNVTFTIPAQNVYVNIEYLEDPYIWVNTKARNSTIIAKYPYYRPAQAGFPEDYRFAENVSAGRLDFLYACLSGPNSTQFGYISYYFPNPNGLTFFDRLENRTPASSTGPASARMSTFLLYNPLFENYGGRAISALDHEYFAGIGGAPIRTRKGSVYNDVLKPTPGPDNVFYINETSRAYLGLQALYTY